MDDEIYSFAIKNALEQIQKACPGMMTHSFIFREDGEVIAGQENTPEQTIVKAINTFDSIVEKAQAIGNVGDLTVEAEDGNINVQHMDNLYLVTVTSKNADMKYVNTLSNVLFPTVLKLLAKIEPAPQRSNPDNEEAEPKSEPHFDYPKPRRIEKHPLKPASTYLEEESSESSEGLDENPEPEEPEFHYPKPRRIEKHPLKPASTYLEEESSESSEGLDENPEPEEPQKLEVTALPEPPISQFMVENIGGLLVPSDTVRIDSVTICKWEELYPHVKIEEVDLEAFNGKTIQCKVKPLKDSKFQGKGIVQMPEKIQSTLEIKKGELVKIKPHVQ